jgi:membrane-associated phospholipid phosphatase
MLTWSHFLSDCIAGFAIGVLSAMLVFAVARSKGFWWESGPGAASPSPTVQSPPG